VRGIQNAQIADMLALERPREATTNQRRKDEEKESRYENSLERLKWFKQRSHIAGISQ
jgi:hypothetical protein